MTSSLIRCTWPGTDPLYVDYHDQVWGVPVLDSKHLFAKLILDGAQAGLSWITILRKEQGYYDAFDGLDPEIMATYDDERLEALRQNPDIIRNRLKIKSARQNAQAWLRMKNEGIDFADFLWSIVGYEPIVNEFVTTEEVPAHTAHSDRMSKALKKEGFSFVGTTICYAFMQAVGMVNDHTTDCFRWQEVQDVWAQMKKNKRS